MRNVITDLSSKEIINKIWGNASSRLGFLTTHHQGIHNVMTIEWMTHVQFSPPTFAISLVKGSKSHENLNSTPEFGLTFASINQKDIIKKLGTTSGNEIDKFKEFTFGWREGNSISTRVITDGVMAVECKVVSKVVLAKSTLFIGEVVCAEFWEKKPLGYHRGVIHQYGEELV